MAFDWTSVEGYREDMSADEKLALLENYSPAEPAPSGDPAPAAAPAAKPTPDSNLAKRQLRSKMSEDEAREADRQAEMAARDEELKSLRRERTLGLNKAAFLGLGLEENLAGEAATMLADGDNDGLFMALKKHQAGFEKTLRAKILAETPKPPASEDPNSEEAKKKDQEQLRRYFGLTL